MRSGSPVTSKWRFSVLMMIPELLKMFTVSYFAL